MRVIDTCVVIFFLFIVERYWIGDFIEDLVVVIELKLVIIVIKVATLFFLDYEDLLELSSLFRYR